MALWVAGAAMVIGAYGAHESAKANDKVNEWQRRMQARIAGHQLQRAQAQLDRYKKVFLPAEKQAAAQAMGGLGSTDGKPADNSGYIANAKGATNADVMQTRALPGPSSALSQRDNIARGVGYGLTGAEETERRRINDVNHSRRVQMLSIGKGIPTQANAFREAALGQAAQTGQVMQDAAANTGKQYAMMANTAANGLSLARNYYGNNNNNPTATASTTTQQSQPVDDSFANA